MSMSTSDFGELQLFAKGATQTLGPNITSISQLEDVQINEPILDGQVLQYIAAIDKWTNVDPQLLSNNFIEGYTSASGDGTTTTFTIAHGFGDVPTHVIVDAQSPEALDDFTISKDAVNLTLEYAFPPPTGTDNLLFYYRVS